MKKHHLVAITLCATALTSNAGDHSPNISPLAPVDGTLDARFILFERATCSRPTSASSHPSSGAGTPSAGTPKPVATQASAELTPLNLGAGAASEKKQS